MTVEDYDAGFQQGWNAAIRAAARVAEFRYVHWNSAGGDGVSCDVTVCEDIAKAIQALKEP